VEIQSSGGQWEAKLTSKGPARFVLLLVLLPWLVLWAIAELVVLSMLVSPVVNPTEWMARWLPQGTSLPTLSVERGSIGLGLMVLLWFGIWTLVGGLALRHALRTVLGKDVLTVQGGTLTLQRYAGPFKSRREIPLSTVMHFDIKTVRGSLFAELLRESVLLSDLGTREEREKVQRGLMERTTGLRPHQPRAELPPEWETGTLEAGKIYLRRRPRPGIRLAMGAVIAGFALIPLSVLTRPEVELSRMLWNSLFCFALLLGGLWVAFAQERWILARHTVIRERTFLGFRFAKTLQDPKGFIEFRRGSKGAEQWSLRLKSARNSAVLDSEVGAAGNVSRLGQWLERTQGIQVEHQSASRLRSG
jgi:hypothetical protein